MPPTILACESSCRDVYHLYLSLLFSKAVKVVPDMSYNVFGWMLNLAQPISQKLRLILSSHEGSKADLATLLCQNLVQF